jgi:sortase (surface protein transpeptidase)
MQLLFPQPTLEIPSLAVEAPVVAVGFADNGGMEVPSNVTDAGWYKYGAGPGGSGHVVVAAHVSTAAQGRGIFYDLRDIELGSIITMMGVDYYAYALEVTSKENVSMERIFLGDDPWLVLVTCGGAFNGDTRHFDSNVVLWAKPLG